MPSVDEREVIGEESRWLAASAMCTLTRLTRGGRFETSMRHLII